MLKEARLLVAHQKKLLQRKKGIEYEKTNDAGLITAMDLLEGSIEPAKLYKE